MEPGRQVCNVSCLRFRSRKGRTPSWTFEMEDRREKKTRNRSKCDDGYINLEPVLPLFMVERRSVAQSEKIKVGEINQSKRCFVCCTISLAIVHVRVCVCVCVCVCICICICNVYVCVQEE